MFITFEGGEGAGKTTLIEKILQDLLARKLPALKTRAPGGTKTGEMIRNLLLQKGESPYLSAASSSSSLQIGLSTSMKSSSRHSKRTKSSSVTDSTTQPSLTKVVHAALMKLSSKISAPSPPSTSFPTSRFTSTWIPKLASSALSAPKTGSKQKISPFTKISAKPSIASLKLSPNGSASSMHPAHQTKSSKKP